MLKRPFAVVFIMLVIFVLLCGIIQKADEPAIKECKDDKVDAKVTGDVYKITSGKDSTLLWIKDSSVMIISGNEEVMYSNIGNIIIYTECDYNNYNIGNRIEVTGKIGRKENASNQGGFDAFLYYHNTFHVDYYVYGKEISTIDEKRNVIKDSLYHFKIAMEKVICQIFDEKEAGIINAMIYGDKSSMNEEIKELFQANGISHILAISGVKTLKLDIPLVPETRINWAFVPLHIAIIYILKLCLDEEIIPRCRFPCSRGYFTKCIN